MESPLTLDEMDSLLQALNDAVPDADEDAGEGHYTQINIDRKDKGEDWYQGFQAGYTYACNQLEGLAKGMSNMDVSTVLKNLNEVAPK